LAEEEYHLGRRIEPQSEGARASSGSTVHTSRTRTRHPTLPASTNFNTRFEAAYGLRQDNNTTVNVTVVNDASSRDVKNVRFCPGNQPQPHTLDSCVRVTSRGHARAHGSQGVLPQATACHMATTKPGGVEGIKSQVNLAGGFQIIVCRRARTRKNTKDWSKKIDPGVVSGRQTKKIAGGGVELMSTRPPV